VAERRSADVQRQALAVGTQGFNGLPILATVVGIPAAAIVLAAAGGREIPVVGSERAGLIALWVLGSVMCAWGIRSMRLRFGYGLANLAGMPLGLLATACIFSALFGWPALLQPVAAALGGAGAPASFDRAAIVAVGVVMAVKWAIAWLAWLPRTNR
jgi:hypothetical protein